MKLDLSNKGLLMVHPDWQIKAMEVLWESNVGLLSRDVWIKVNEKLKPDRISRASVINFLNYMLGLGVLSGVDETGKGGHRMRYSPAMNKEEYKIHIAETAIKTLKENYPAEFQKAVNNIT
jgi:predicted transcriptional regulator